MTHFGIFCPAAIGHLNPMCNLGRELLRRGHQVTLFGVPDVQSKIAQSGLEFYEVGGKEFPIGTVESVYAQLGKLSGLAGLKFSIQFFQKEAEMWFKRAPDAIQIAQVDVLLVDQVTTAIGTVADFLKLPFITVCNALLINREPDVPPYFTHWNYQNKPWQRLRNQAGNALIAYLTRPIWDTITQQRQQWQLPALRHREDSYSQLAQICQLPAVLDFPRKRLAKCFHYTGPLQDPSGNEPVTFKDLEFPFEQLTHSKVIYASLGTLQNRNWEIFHKIAEACLDLDAQLVISLGNPTQDVAAANFPGSPLVVAYAPHQHLIRRSTLVITHAGLNTVIGTLSDGVPIVAIPITNEQPGIAARVARTGSGKVVPLAQLTVPMLRSVITEVLNNPSYRENAARIQTAIKESGGVKVAADIIEQVLTVAK
jgi:zeaxanthin glucosyltransferase